jgi:hypothetical protein
MSSCFPVIPIAPLHNHVPFPLKRHVMTWKVTKVCRGMAFTARSLTRGVATSMMFGTKVHSDSFVDDIVVQST